jgi:hypothetical protein
VLVVSPDDYLWFVDQALDQMVAIVEELGDDRVNQRPELEGANSAYAIVTHCLGVMEFWGGLFVAGRNVERDRAAEFRARGSIASLVSRVADARRQLEADVAQADSTAPPRHAVRGDDADLPLGKSQGAVLLHIYEELSQHLGQMELTRDLLMAG